MPESLAVRAASIPSETANSQLECSGGATSLTRVHEVLEAFASRDSNGEVLTAVRHFPARAAVWTDFPAWGNHDLAAAYAAKGIRQLYRHNAPAPQAIPAAKTTV